MDLTRTLVAALLTVALLPAAPPANAAAASCDSASSADFNGDGRDDIAVGDPAATVGNKVAAGAVTVVYGKDKVGDGARSVITLDSPGVAPGKAAAGDGFGLSVHTAHIDGDRCLDLVVGAPWRDAGTQPDVGAVSVIFGSPQGLGRGRAGVPLTPEAWGSAQPNELFGWSVGAADARGVDPASVVVGAPYEDRKAQDGSQQQDAGAVHVTWLKGDGAPGPYKTFGQGADGVPGVPEAGDQFGWAVDLGSVGGDAGRRDLLVTEPFEDVANEGNDAGSVSVVYDVSASSSPGFEHWHYENLGLSPSNGGLIGFSLAYVEDGGTAYVAAGVPGQPVDGKARAGAVQLFTSTGGGLKPAGTFDQNKPGVRAAADGVKTAAEADDRFGWSVALAGQQLTGAGVQLAVGAPYESGPAGRNGFVALIPLANPGQGVLIDAANPDIPGDPGDGDDFGWSVAFAGDHNREGALLIGTPNDREAPTGSVVVRPFGGNRPRLLVPDGKGFPADDMTDFGVSLTG